MIIPATLDDLEAIQELHDQLDLPGEPVFWALRSTIRSFMKKNSLFVSKEHAILGAIGVEDYSRYLRIESLAVDPSAQGRGVGRSLVDYAREVAATRGLRELQVGSREVYGARPFYLSCGFKIIEENDITGEYECAMSVSMRKTA
jgi:N-acetylglutamate synthase-like GNAT family acetyltransferase